MSKRKQRDPQEALQTKLKMVAQRIEKILLESELALYPYTEDQPNGAKIPRVRLISTALPPNKPSNDEQTGNTEEAGVNQDTDGAAEPKSA